MYNSLESTITEPYQISKCITLLSYNYIFITQVDLKDINIIRNGTKMCLSTVI